MEHTRGGAIMSEKLKSCPFCGSEAKIYSVRNIYRIYCDNEKCYVCPDIWHKGTFEEVAQRWNTRVEEQS